jgi:hypothetical protein
MEALSAYMRERHGFMAGRLKEGKAPNAAQLSGFLRGVCGGCAPLVQADGVPESVAIDLRLGFASVGWDVKTNAPDPSVKTPPSPEKVMGFLDKAAIKFAPGKPPAPGAPPAAAAAAAAKKDAPKKLKLEVSVADDAATAGANDDDAGLQFGAPAAQEARQAQDARAAKLVPTGMRAPPVSRAPTPCSRVC